MKNAELYNEIKQLVKERQEMPVQNPSFAQKYCQQQLNKKKLNPYDPRQKMNHLMKNFQQLETFVDVKALLECIQSKHKFKDIQNKKNAQILSQFIPTATPNKQNNFMASINETISKKLSKQIMNKYQLNQKVVDQIISLLEANRENKSFQNNTSSPEIIVSASSLAKMEEQQVNFQLSKTQKKNQKMFFLNDSAEWNIEQTKQYADLIHQVSTYLQIILETQHRKKWHYEQNSKISTAATTTKASNFNTTARSNSQNLFKSSRLNQSRKGGIPLIKILSTTRRPRIKSKLNKQMLTKRKVQQSFTFRNRTVKGKIMNEVKDFINLVEDYQRIFKQQNKRYNLDISKLEHYRNIEFSKFKEDPIMDDQGFNAVRVRALQFK